MITNIREFIVMEYNFKQLEEKWQKFWLENRTFHVEEDQDKKKFYVLDMFPYPSGAGLHVGHPLGYIASDIIARYKRLQGFNVLHPIGFDSFGLPAEQYAIQTGQHPALTTKTNIDGGTNKEGNVIPGYRKQLMKIGFSFNWEREVRTSDPDYYKWTQWIFIQLYNAWYNLDRGKAEPIDTLIAAFEKKGSDHISGFCSEDIHFTAEQWQKMSETEKQKILLNYRLAYLAEAVVNWCPELGTVLANDEVKDGMSERGGYPVVQKRMKQWSLRIMAYAQRLLDDLDDLDWSDSLKDMQRSWIGRSEGANIYFRIDKLDEKLKIFTTRPDTIFGATFMVLSPEHEMVKRITTKEKLGKVLQYIDVTAKRTEKDRMADKKVSGVFTGSYAVNPFTEKKIPVWIADYVLAGYGTGAIMAVPSGDQRDWEFATHFNLPIIPVVEGTDISKGAHEPKEGRMINSGFLNGMPVQGAIKAILTEIEQRGIGKKEINYRLRDAVFGRQRYWGEPIPVYYKNGIPYVLNEKELPLKLPEVDKYLPTEKGEPPLARAEGWRTKDGYELEKTTMPGWAGSSWYYLRYMDPHNSKEFAAKDKISYWQNIDLYMGGAEHTTGHLLYFRFWCKFLYDMGYIPFKEPAKTLINQGMITAISYNVHFNKEKKMAVSADVIDAWLFMKEDGYKLPVNLKNEIPVVKQLEQQACKVEDFMSLKHVLVDFVKNDILDVEQYKNWHAVKDEFKDFEFIPNSRKKFKCSPCIDKMSKSKYNVVNPDDIIEKYGADTLRLYEMFLGPIRQHKPWDTDGIEGTFRFLKKLWKLFHANEEFSVSDEEPLKEELRILHKTIRKVKEDIVRYSFNTVVSEYMICVNKLSAIGCNKRNILEPLVILVSPFAPHIAEELWNKLGHGQSISAAKFPDYEDKYIRENTFTYPVSFNGKMRFKISLPVEQGKEEIERAVLSDERTKKYLQGNEPKKIIVVPLRIVNVVF